MFTEEELRAFTDELGGLWANLEREIVVKLCTRVKEIGKLAPADTHKLIQLAHVSGDISGIQQSIAQTLSVSEQAVHALYEQAAQGDDEFQAGVLEKLGKPVIPFEQNTFLQGLIADVVKVTNGEIRNMTRTTGFTNRYGQWEPLSKVYQDTVDYAIMQVRSGVVDYHSAMRSAVQKLADEGLQHIEYDNPGKRYYRRRLDSSVRNAFSGGMQRLSQAQNERLGRQFGADGMEVTFHRGARPAHAEMGGRQYPMKQYNSEIVPLLMENNCYHRAFPILLGISPPTYGGKELAALKAQDAEKHTFEGKEYNAYEARQMQRRMETAIRRQKDRAVAAGKAGDKEGEQTALIKGAALSQKYAQFSKATGLSYKGTRVTAGLNRSQSARLGAQTRRLNANKPLDDGNGIKPTRITEEAIQKAYVPRGKLMDEARYALLDEYAKQVLRAAKDEPFGTEVAITTALKDMGYLSTVTGNPGAQSVKVPTESIDYVVLHNHPSNEMFSLGDIHEFAKSDRMKAMVVVGNNGQGYLVEKVGKYDSARLSRRIAELQGPYERDPISTVNVLLEEAAQYGIHFVK